MRKNFPVCWPAPEPHTSRMRQRWRNPPIDHIDVDARMSESLIFGYGSMASPNCFSIPILTEIENRQSNIESLDDPVARASTFGGIVNPICFAVFRLMMSSNFVGCSTGRSAGLAPLRILST